MCGLVGEDLVFLDSFSCYTAEKQQNKSFDSVVFRVVQLPGQFREIQKV